jgi:hypothetical protein
LFSNLTNEELYWLAGRLRASLNFKWKSQLSISTAFDEDGDIIAPQRTRLKIDRHGGRTTVEIPAAPIGTLVPLLCFLILSLAFTAGIIWATVQQGDLGGLFFVVPIGGIINTTAIAGLVYSLRRWTIVASQYQLAITRRWPLGTKEQTFNPENIKTICLRQNGFQSNNQTHYHLEVDTHQKNKAIALMSNWSVKELKYVAATLYEALKMDHTSAVDEATSP